MVAMVKNIIFDLADVILTGTNHTSLALVKKYNLVPAEQGFLLHTPLHGEFLHGNVSEDDYMGEVVNLYPQLGGKDALKQHIRDNFIEVDGTRTIIVKLKQLGYKLGLLSIHAKEWIEYCDQKFNINGMFDAIAYSYTDKVSKPNKRSFELILERLSAQPDECLFIDDTLANVQAAQDMGITSIQFSSAPELHKKLQAVLPDYS